MLNINDSSSALPSALDDKTPAAATPADPRYAAKATEAAVKFEAFFISHMLRQMRSGTREMAGEDSVFKDPVNSDMLEMADNLVADKMAGQRAFGRQGTRKRRENGHPEGDGRRHGHQHGGQPAPDVARKAWALERKQVLHHSGHGRILPDRITAYLPVCVEKMPMVPMMSICLWYKSGDSFQGEILAS